jgi:Laminin B (Domain IV).
VDDVADAAQLFFSAPAIFLGNKRSSYMYYLTFDMAQKSDVNPRDRTQEGDIVIKGKNQNFKLVLLLTLPPLVHPLFRFYKVGVII